MKHTDETLQAAIDAAMLEIGRQITGNNFAASLDYEASWPAEQSDRLALAKAFLAKLPETEPSMALQQLAGENGNSQAIQEVQKYASTLTVEGINGLLKAIQECLPEPQPILADDGRSLGQVLYEAHEKFVERLLLEESSTEARNEYQTIALAVANVVLAQVIRRMEAVPVEELKQIWYQIEAIDEGLEAVRAHLIAAAKGEAEQQPVTETPAQTVNEQPKQKVPLGPEDVMPQSYFRRIGDFDKPAWITCLFCMNEEVAMSASYKVEHISYRELMGDWQINRSIPLTGKWDANAWKPCFKLI